MTGNIFAEDGETIIFTFPLKPYVNGAMHPEDEAFMEWLTRNRDIIKRQSEKKLRKLYKDATG